MKNLILLITLFFFNTVVLLAEPVARLVQNVNPWIFIFTEVLLLWIVYLIFFFKNARKESGKRALQYEIGHCKKKCLKLEVLYKGF